MDADRVFTSLQNLTTRYRIPGVQLAVHDRGRTTAIEAGDHELTPASAFPIGSITKACTATLVMILASDGEIELDVPVVEYVPELRSLPGALSTNLTSRHLLSHTGGLSDDDVPVAASPRAYVLDCCRDLPGMHRPGTGFSYSSVGYVLVGCVIENVTGMTWHEAVAAILLEPLGIPATFIAGGPRPASPFVPGHSVNLALDRTCQVQQTLTPAEGPAGGLAMSAADLVRFGTYLCGDDFAEMRKAVPQAQPFGLADGWGLGLASFRHNGTDWWGHDGNADGASCHLRLDPVNETVIALTTNANTGFAMWKELVGELRAAGLTVGDYVALRGTESRTEPSIDCTGTYVNGRTAFSVVAGADGTLTLVVDGEPFAELTLYDGFLFAMREVTSGATVHMGRFLAGPGMERADRIQVGGRLAWRNDRYRKVS